MFPIVPIDLEMGANEESLEISRFKAVYSCEDSSEGNISFLGFELERSFERITGFLRGAVNTGCWAFLFIGVAGTWSASMMLRLLCPSSFL